MADDRYPIPAGSCRVEIDVKRSRFIASIAPAPTVADARVFIDSIRSEFPGATHNCWAYLVGAPGRTDQVGMSDDGEPHGTAGRPMLTVLTHCGLGNVATVVTRYFGGTKLGRGGLVRAYSDALQAGLDAVPRGERIEWAHLEIGLPYAAVQAFGQMLGEFEADIERSRYEATVVHEVRLPRPHVDRFTTAIADMSNGTATVRAL